MMVLVFAPYFIILGIIMTVPSLTGFSMAMMAGTSVLMNLQTVFTVDFEFSVNSMVASIFGLMTAALVIRFIRSIGSDHALKRLSIAGWRDLAGLLRVGPRESRASFITRMTDRLVLRLPRLAMAPEAVREKFASFRASAVGIDIIILRDLLRHHDRADCLDARQSLMAVTDFFSQLQPDDQKNPEHTASLLAQIDHSLAVIFTAANPAWEKVTIALAGLRFDLDPQADLPLLTLEHNHGS